MKQSSSVQHAVQDFYARYSTQDIMQFEQQLARGVAVLVVGTGPMEWYDGRQQCAEAFAEQVAALPGLRIESGALQGWEEGDIGWAADQPTFVLADGTRIPVRVTVLLRREDGVWRFVQVHTSFGVPDETVLALAAEGRA